MTENIKGTISRIVGPVVEARNMRGAKIFDVVRVGKEQLLGEIIRINEDVATIQVYEETAGLQPHEPVHSTGLPLSVELGPGILRQVYDGVQRPLDLIKKQSGTFIKRGIQVNGIDKKKKWEFIPTIQNGTTVKPGQIIGEVQETELIKHHIMVPHGVEGKITGLKKGNYTVEQPIAKVGKINVTMLQKWPVKQGRPYANKLAPDVLLVSGQRVIDFLFPLPKGAAACIPGPFGAGKTVTQQTLAKWVDADIIIYVGCGERGNEMTDVLFEFPELTDPASGKPLMERTVLVANTSNMPVAAREASIYTGMTLAEYYRDMGYDVALMADSTSRWAEAMREISGRLEEMPGEEGYPAYLGTRLASFYERAGRVQTLSGKTGSVTAIGAVSPPGGDFSEPVTQNTLRITKVFWGLDSALASKRHFPSINWLNSYSLYFDQLDPWFEKNAGKGWAELRTQTTNLLQKEAELQEIVQIVGPDALPEKEKMVLEVTRMIREDFLQQNAFHEVDTYCPLEKQYKIIKAILSFHEKARSLEKVDSEKLMKFSSVTGIARLKYIENKQFAAEFEKLEKKMAREFEAYEKALEVAQ